MRARAGLRARHTDVRGAGGVAHSLGIARVGEPEPKSTRARAWEGGGASKVDLLQKLPDW